MSFPQHAGQQLHLAFTRCPHPYRALESDNHTGRLFCSACYQQLCATCRRPMFSRESMRTCTRCQDAAINARCRT